MSFGKYLGELNDESIGRGDPKYIVSIDDTSLKRQTLLCSDNGGNKEGNVRKYLYQFITAGLKPTIYFIPCPKYTFISDVGRRRENKEFDVNINTENEFILWLKKYEKQQLLEIALHGYEHLNNKVPGYYSFEFDGLNEGEMEYKLSEGWSALKKSFAINGFKPPAWSVGNLSDNRKDFIRALQSFGKFKYASLSSPNNGLNYNKKTVSHCHLSNYSDLINVPQNVSILWEWEKIRRVVDIIVKKRGIVNLQLHSQECSIFFSDGLSTENCKKVFKIERIP